MNMRISLALIFFFVAFSTFAGNDYLLITQNATTSIGKNILLLEDKGGELTIDDVVKQQSLFSPCDKDIPVFGPTPSAWWAKFQINNLNGEEWYLQVGKNHFEEADLYWKNPSGEFNKISAGVFISPKKKIAKTGDIIFPLHIKKGETIAFYLRLKTTTLMRFPLYVKTLTQIYETSRMNMLGNGLYMGLAAAIIFYNFLVFMVVRQKVYLYYLLYLLAITLVTISMEGLNFEIIPDSLSWLNDVGLFNTLSFLFGILFTNSFLQISKNAPKLKSISNFLIAGLCVLLILFAAGSKQLLFSLSLIISLPIIVYFLSAGIIMYKQGYRPARLYLLGYGFYCAGGVISVLKDNGVLPPTIFIENFFRMASAAEILILSFGLAMKLHYYKSESEKMQATALQQASEFSTILITNQENERKRIAGELHDSVGQSLILAKSRIHMLQKNAEEKIKIPLENIIEILNDTVQEVRTISYALRPFQLDLLGMTQAVKSLVEEVEDSSGIVFTAEIQNIDHVVSKEKEINIYRIIQECLNNIVKHSGAERASVKAFCREHHLLLEIKDYGKGLADVHLKEKYSGFGLTGIRDRIKLLKGTLQVEACQPHGTVISITVPTEAGLSGTTTIT